MIFTEAWLSDEPAALPTGTTFDAIRVCEHHGEAALQRMTDFGATIGTIVGDHDQWWFLIPPGHGDEPWPQIAHHLGKNSWLTVPALKSGATDRGELRWVRRTDRENLQEFTEPLLLRTVLDLISTGTGN